MSGICDAHEARPGPAVQLQVLEAIAAMARDCREINSLIAASGDNIIITPLASAIRLFWIRAQVRLALADARCRLPELETAALLEGGPLSGLGKPAERVLARAERRVLHTTLQRRCGMQPLPAPEAFKETLQ